MGNILGNIDTNLGPEYAVGRSTASSTQASSFRARAPSSPLSPGESGFKTAYICPELDKYI